MSRAGSGWYRKYMVVTLGCCLSMGLFGARPGPARADGARAGWGQLDLGKAVIAGTRVYYEKGLEPNLPLFEQEYRKFLATKERLAAVQARRQEIIADINRILGATDADTGRQAEVFARVASPLFSDLKPTFYLVRTATIKAVLRAGGQLPGFTYERERDTFVYSPEIRIVENARTPENFEFCLLIGPGKEFGRSVAAMLLIPQKLLGFGMVDIAIHEVTEMTLVQRVEIGDPYWRWFTDGFANAIARLLVEKYMGAEAGREFAAHYDASKSRDLEREINLRYWMMANFCINTEPMPVAAEGAVTQARYAYAMAEAQALIDKHGVECVGKILDAISRRESRKGSDLLRVIRDVTGEDMEERLARYQTFRTPAEGLAKYEQAYQAAAQKEDYAQMFLSVSRGLELRGGELSEESLQDFQRAAGILFQMGHEEAGDEVLRNAVELYSASSAAQNRAAALERFVLYALDCNHPRKAESAADELLQGNPDHIPSLLVEMLISVEDNELTRAHGLARHVRCLAQADSPAYRLATKVLADDPNVPAGQEGAAQSK
jgi:hypothetical protein